MDKAFQERLHREIPLSDALGVRAVKVSGDGAVLTAPLAPNINYNRTAFGGSVYSVAVLSCWALVTKFLQEQGYNIDYVVVQDGQMSYKAPVDGDFTAESSWPSVEHSEKFLAMLKRKGIARAELQSVIRTRGTECGRLDARFVAEIKKPK